jgi:NADH dehydrogenase FAD-containing subunit
MASYSPRVVIVGGGFGGLGKGFAVLQTGTLRISGFLAWLAWAAVHLEFLGQSSLRTYVTGQRGSRLIVNHHAPASGAARTPSSRERQPVGTR